MTFTSLDLLYIVIALAIILLTVFLVMVLKRVYDILGNVDVMTQHTSRITETIDTYVDIPLHAGRAIAKKMKRYWDEAEDTQEDER